jgi:hypothetical protein
MLLSSPGPISSCHRLLPATHFFPPRLRDLIYHFRSHSRWKSFPPFIHSYFRDFLLSPSIGMLGSEVQPACQPVLTCLASSQLPTPYLVNLAFHYLLPLVTTTSSTSMSMFFLWFCILIVIKCYDIPRDMPCVLFIFCFLLNTGIKRFDCRSKIHLVIFINFPERASRCAELWAFARCLWLALRARPTW